MNRDSGSRPPGRDVEQARGEARQSGAESASPDSCSTNPTQPTVGQGEDMAQDTGVPLSGSGSRPSGGAATASPAKPSIPNADERLAELLALEENWNSYSGRPVDRPVAERVRAFHPLADKLGLAPWICPLSDGSLQIERAGTDDYCVEFHSDGTASVYFDGLSDKDALGFLSQFALVQALNRAASGTLTEGGDAKLAPGESLSGPVPQGDAHD